MSFEGFFPKDFDVFSIEGLDERMEAIIHNIRPKFELIGSHFSPFLSSMTGDEMFYHVAKHARRTVNPPKDTWIAWSNNKRGYKMVPHFQVGLWETHLFVWFAIIYEAPTKAIFAEKMLPHVEEIKKNIPDHFVWSWDHTKKESYPHDLLTVSDLEVAFHRLKNIKKAEILCGIEIPREDLILQDGPALLLRIEETFSKLTPLYRGID